MYDETLVREDSAVLTGCRVVVRVEIWFVRTLLHLAVSLVGWKESIQPWALMGVLELKGQSGVGVVTPAPSEAREARWVSSPGMIPSETGMDPPDDPYNENKGVFSHLFTEYQEVTQNKK